MVSVVDPGRAPTPRLTCLIDSPALRLYDSRTVHWRRHMASKLTKTAAKIGGAIGRVEGKARAAAKLALEETERLEKSIRSLTNDLKRAQKRLKKLLS